VDTTNYAKSTQLFEKLQQEAEREAKGLKVKVKGDHGGKGQGNDALKFRL